SEAMPKLRPLLDRSTDPDFLAKTVDSLDALAGQPAESDLETADRVKRWKVALGNLEETPSATTAVAAKDQMDTIATKQGAPRRSLTAAGVPAAKIKEA